MFRSTLYISLCGIALTLLATPCFAWYYFTLSNTSGMTLKTSVNYGSCNQPPHTSDKWDIIHDDETIEFISVPNITSKPKCTGSGWMPYASIIASSEKSEYDYCSFSLEFNPSIVIGNAAEIRVSTDAIIECGGNLDVENVTAHNIIITKNPESSKE